MARAVGSWRISGHYLPFSVAGAGVGGSDVVPAKQGRALTSSVEQPQRCRLQQAQAPVAAMVAGVTFLQSAVVLRRQRQETRSRCGMKRSRLISRAQWHPGSEVMDNEADHAEVGCLQEEEMNEHDHDGDGSVVDASDSAYSCLGTHREMIEDKVRTESFRRAIFETCKDKVVLEVGCGTGILSLFAAQAGAARVVAVEVNEEVAEYAHELIYSNGFADRVSVVVGAVEDVAEEIDELLISPRPDQGAGHERPIVDVVISEWMGFMLVCEGMFSSVAFARDRWLAPGGRMLPEACEVRLAPFSFPGLMEKMTGFWHSKPYGVDLSALALRALDQHLSQPVVDTLPSAENVLATPWSGWRLDCTKALGQEPDEQTTEFDFVVERAGAFHGLAAWFTCELCPGVSFSTGPENVATHWEQTLLSPGLDSPTHDLLVNPGDRVKGRLRWLVAGYSMGVQMSGAVCLKRETALGIEVDSPAFDEVPFARRLVLHVS